MSNELPDRKGDAMNPDEPPRSIVADNMPAATEPAPAPEGPTETGPATLSPPPSGPVPGNPSDDRRATLPPASASAPESSPDGGPAAPENRDDAEMSFAEMLARQEDNDDPGNRLEPGRRVRARVVAVTADTVFVSTGSKVDGIVDREEMETDGEPHCRIGDMLDLYVLSVSPHEVKLSRMLRGAGSLSALEEAREAGLPVEGKVAGPVKGGYAVEVMKRRAFCPLSQMDLRPADDPETHTGKLYPFLITRLEKGGRNIVLSRRALLEREQTENLETLLADLNEGDEREAVVTRFAPFGAFLELAPGIEGMAHLSELSWSRVGRADEAVSIGDRVRVKVLDIKKDGKGPRISLSLRRTTGDPWRDAGERLVPGEIVAGRVTRTAPFGAFVEVLPGIEGLVHISELSYEKRVAKAEEIVTAGDDVSVKIRDVDVAKRRVSLSLREAAGDPWATVRESLPLDADLTGTVEKRAPFGFFVTLSPGISGLLSNAAVHASPMRNSLERLGPGDAVRVRAREINAEKRRISLIPAGDAEESVLPDKDWKKHAPKSPPSPSTGTLGLALQEALRKKKSR
jgi:small subunit ribosomal protein S1